MVMFTSFCIPFPPDWTNGYLSPWLLYLKDLCYLICVSTVCNTKQEGKWNVVWLWVGFSQEKHPLLLLHRSIQPKQPLQGDIGTKPYAVERTAWLCLQESFISWEKPSPPTQERPKFWFLAVSSWQHPMSTFCLFTSEKSVRVRILCASLLTSAEAGEACEVSDVIKNHRSV